MGRLRRLSLLDEVKIQELINTGKDYNYIVNHITKEWNVSLTTARTVLLRLNFHCKDAPKKIDTDRSQLVKALNKHKTIQLTAKRLGLTYSIVYGLIQKLRIKVTKIYS